MEAITAVWQAIQMTLDEMGKQAVMDGMTYGLRCYPLFHKTLPSRFSRTDWEDRITDGLRLGLSHRGFLVRTESYYPGTRKRCDLIVTLKDGNGEFWIECKIAYPESIQDQNGSKTSVLYGKNSWIAGVSDIRAKDIVKLNQLTRATATYVGILLLGFDRVLMPIPSDLLYTLLPSDLETWCAEHVDGDGIIQADHYVERANRGFRNRLWFWWRPVAG